MNNKQLANTSQGANSSTTTRREQSFPSTSIWSEKLPHLGSHYTGGSMKVHTAVIGGGLTGLSAAFHLLKNRPDQQVVVLEANSIGGGASSRSTGMLTPGVGQDLSALVQRWGKHDASVMYRQSLRAVEYVGELTAREGIECQLRMTGQLIVARGRSGRKRLSTWVKTFEDLDLPCEQLDDAALAEVIRLKSCPEPRQDYPAALRLPVAGVLHPGLLLAGLTRSIQKRSGQVYEGARVVDLSKSQPVKIRLADGGEITAEHVVLATGGYTPEMGFLRGRILPLHLQILLTEPLTPAALEVLGWARREGIIDSRRIFNYFRLTEDNRILFGGGTPQYRWRGSTDEGFRAETNLKRLVAELTETFPSEAALQIERSWSGVIDYVLDTLPVIGRLRSHPNVVYVGGWCGHGIALSVSSGVWVSHLIEHGRPPEKLPWFRDRAPLVPLEPIRWLATPISSRAMSVLDRF